jgi:hypothetical protein
MDIWSFRKCVHGGGPENWRIEKKWTVWVYPCNISCGMQMKENICLTGLLMGMNHGCIVTNPDQSMLQCIGNIQVHLQPKSLRLQMHHRLGSLCLPCFGIISPVSPFSEAWWKCELCIILWSSVEASEWNLQKTSRPAGKGSTALSWQCQTPFIPSNPGENSITTVGTSWTMALQPGLGP